ncbi:MAG: hypothetical protein QOG93_1479 [Gaiellaceae bacterium]|nr:hypothetical protein [Gaiellaceae bacterium]MDX6387138.1 hypothetical protein [Gaiellaceae bacterium]
MLLDRVTETDGDLVDRALEPWVAEGLHLAAVAADEVMMVVAVGTSRLVARDAVAGVDPLHEAKIGERLERPVDRGDPDRTPSPAKAIEDLLRAHAAVLAPEQVDDRAAGAAAAEPGGV